MRSGGGAGVIVGSLFECPECLESSELISDGMASLDNPPELETEILQLILSELTNVVLVYTMESVKVDISSILPIYFCDVLIWYVDQFEPFLVSECVDTIFRLKRKLINGEMGK